MQSRPHLPLQSKRTEPASCSLARGRQSAFEGTIASAFDLGIRVDQFIEMVRLVRASDPGAARFLEAWDALTPSAQQSIGAADAACEQVGLAPLELLKSVADAACRYAMYAAQIAAAVALPSVVGRSIEAALANDGTADRKMLFQHSGFLPTSGGSKTSIAITQNAEAKASAQASAAPRPEETIRRMCDRFNDTR